MSLTLLRFDSLEMGRLVYKNMSSLGGPLPAFNLGVMIDSTKSSVGYAVLELQSCWPANTPRRAMKRHGCSAPIWAYT